MVQHHSRSPKQVGRLHAGAITSGLTGPDWVACRVPHGPINFTSDNAFGEEADLVVWGHEHDCIDQARPQPVTGRRYYISQPGSSIATSLAAGEAIPK